MSESSLFEANPRGQAAGPGLGQVVHAGTVLAFRAENDERLRKPSGIPFQRDYWQGGRVE